MDAHLRERLDKILAELPAEPVVSGLQPASRDLSRLFTATAEQIEPEALYRFCCDYIVRVPEQTEALAATASSLNLGMLVETYTELATRYLDSACTELENSEPRAPMEAFLIVLQGAYIYSRMQEELDEKIRAFVGVPLTNVDLMDANLIVHDIIGDSFANRLDKVVETLIQQSKVSKSVIEADLDRLQLEQARENGASLSGREVKNYAAQHGLSLMSGLI